MAFQQIVGQDHVIGLLEKGLQNNKITHAYCFLGPKGVGKRKTALQLAKALNCEQTPGEPCGQCATCKRIESGNHPDVTTVLPEGAGIKISQIRKLQQSSRYLAAEGTTKVILIENAELFTVQAANSLLRFLEEPTTHVVVILMVENIHLLLPTIVSRCQVLRFSAKGSEVHRTDQQGTLTVQERAFSFLQNNVDRAEYPDEDQFISLCHRVIEWTEEIFSGKSSALITIQSGWFQKEIEKNKGTTLLDLLLLWLRDCLNVQLKRADQEGFVLPAWNGRSKKDWNRSHLLIGMESVLQARQQLSRYIQPQSVVEQMVLTIQEELLRGKSDRSPL